MTLNELPDEVSGNKITFRWSRVEGALSYRVYKRITTQDGDGNEWERVMLTTDDSCEIKVERGKTYQFKVIGVNKDDDEGKESNIRTVKVLGEIRFPKVPYSYQRYHQINVGSNSRQGIYREFENLK